MDKMKVKTILSETKEMETKDKEPKEKEIPEAPKEKETSEAPKEKKMPEAPALIGGGGLLELIHDTIGRITDILQEASSGAKAHGENEDKVEFVDDAPEDTNIKALPFAGEKSDACGMLAEDDLKNMVPGDNIVTEESPINEMKNKPFSIEILNDNDFDNADPVVNNFKNEMGGVGGMIKILKISGPNSLEKLAVMYDKLNQIRIANRATELQEVFQHVNNLAAGKGARHQLIAVQKLEKLAKDSSKEERFALLKAKDAILEGTAQHLDAAGFRIRGVFSQYAPEKMVRTAYTNLETQSGELIMMPQGKHQLGYPTTLELSKFRDHSVDAKIDPNTGEVKNGYVGFEQRRDNMEAARNRFEIHRNPVNDESLLTLAKNERAKPLTKNERNFEQRLDEDVKGRYDEKSWEKSREQMLDDTPEAKLGHHGEPKEDESIARTLSKTAQKYDKIDPKSDDTLGGQIANSHKDIKKDMTLEEMLDDERVGLTDEELDMLLEEWLEKSRED
jgi:hypothetical protein